MASGRITGAYRGYQLKTTWSSETDVPENKSIISCQHDLVISRGYDLGCPARSNTCEAGDDLKSFTSPSISTSGGETIRLGTTTHEVQHDSNGEKKCDLTTIFNWRATISGVYVANITATKQITLDTIPRGSSIVANNPNIGEICSISINRSSDNFLHTLSYKLAGQTDFTEIATGIGYKLHWPIPDSFYQLINSKNSICALRCQTYSVDETTGAITNIGDPVDINITITANETICRPVINSTSLIDTNPNTIALTNDSAKIVKYKSNIQIDLNATLKNYANLQSLVINGESVIPTIVTSGGTTTINCTYIKENFSGTTIPIVITDSRGYTNTYFTYQSANTEGENYFVLVPYVQLTINSTFKRETQASSVIQLRYTGNFYNGEFAEGIPNILNLSWAVREKGTTEYTAGETPISAVLDNNTYSNGTSPITLVNPIEETGEFDFRKIYEFVIYYSDLLENLNTQPQIVTKGIENFGIFQNGITINGEYKNILELSYEIVQEW